MCDLERLIMPARRQYLGIDRLHTRAGWPGADSPFHPRHSVRVALDVGLDPSIGQVPDVAGDPLPRGDVLHVIPEANALDAAADEKLTGDAHAEEARIILVPVPAPSAGSQTTDLSRVHPNRREGASRDPNRDNSWWSTCTSGPHDCFYSTIHSLPCRHSVRAGPRAHARGFGADEDHT